MVGEEWMWMYKCCFEVSHYFDSNTMTALGVVLESDVAELTVCQEDIVQEGFEVSLMIVVANGLPGRDQVLDNFEY